jgi:hypothetical protein
MHRYNGIGFTYLESLYSHIVREAYYRDRARENRVSENRSEGSEECAPRSPEPYWGFGGSAGRE